LALNRILDKNFIGTDLLFKYKSIYAYLCVATLNLHLNLPTVLNLWTIELVWWLCLDLNMYNNIIAPILTRRKCDFKSWGVREAREHCYRKKAATVGQNGRLSASYNFFSFLLIKS
jgi:hypothetical protein